MTDVHTKAQRSRNMAAIHGKGNKSTEIKLIRLLRKYKLTGWRRHYEQLPGKPDVVFPRKKLAIFLDGCFWHGCPCCKLNPASNRKFWRKKIGENKIRDRKNTKQIKAGQWKVMRIWEHQLKSNPHNAIRKIQEVL